MRIFHNRSMMEGYMSAAQNAGDSSCCACPEASCANQNVFFVMDTIIMVSIFVILALGVLSAILCLVLLTVILTILAAISVSPPTISNEQP